MTTATQTWTEEFVEIAGGRVHLLRGGNGDPALVLHHDIGNPGWTPFYESLARRHTVLVPEHPGWGQSDRPTWMRSVRDVAVAYQWLLANQGIDRVSLIGLGFGGWIAAEMATMAPRQVSRLVLVGAMGVQPLKGEIFDQSLVSTTEYVTEGLHDPAVLARVFGEEVSSDQLEAWEIHREMAFRIAWKPYMFSQTLPHLLGGVRAPALLVWGDDDRIVPRACAERYQSALPNTRLEIVPGCGHFVDLEKPDELDRLVSTFSRG